MARNADEQKTQWYSRNEEAARPVRLGSPRGASSASAAPWVAVRSTKLPQFAILLCGEMGLVVRQPLVGRQRGQIRGGDRRCLGHTPVMTGHGSPCASIIPLRNLQHMMTGWGCRR